MVLRPIFGFVAWQEPQYCLHHGFSTRQAPLRMDLQLVTDSSRYTDAFDDFLMIMDDQLDWLID